MNKETRFKCKLFEEMSDDSITSFFEFKQRKFLHNIDTFYYSVKFDNDFRLDTKDPNVKEFRKFFEFKYSILEKVAAYDSFSISEFGPNIVIRPVTFSRFYKICLSYPEYFDIFFAPSVPQSSEGSESVTCECVVQIRSYMLWQFGVHDCFENSYEYVKEVASYFGLSINHVQENRVDYCWHSNYFSNPEKFFEPENFYKMRVDRFKNATYITNKVGNEDYEIDYVCLGKRSDKVFIRIYQKTREVVEQGYKPWFLKIWQMNGLINKYDQFVYEKAFEKRNWFYRFYARLEFYVLYGSDSEEIKKCKDILSGSYAINEQDLINYCDKLTPPLNYVINVEYQTMRRHSKSYCLVPFKDRTDKEEKKRVYEYFDNRKIITDYLTDKVFRLTKYDPDVPKYQREMCAFWESLRRTKCIDMKLTKEDVKLVREYNKNLSVETMKKRFVYSAVTLGLYTRGKNSDNPLQDCMESLLRMNDNDIKYARRYKQKKLRELNPDELAEVFESDIKHRLSLIDEETGALYDYDSIMSDSWQGGLHEDIIDS